MPDGKLEYTSRPDGSVTEVMPDRCASGRHRLTPGQVSIGWNGSRRTYTCDLCADAGVRRHTLEYETRPRQTPR